MPKQVKRATQQGPPPKDVNQWARRLVDLTTEPTEPTEPTDAEVSKVMAALGRRGEDRRETSPRNHDLRGAQRRRAQGCACAVEPSFFSILVALTILPSVKFKRAATLQLSYQLLNRREFAPSRLQVGAHTLFKTGLARLLRFGAALCSARATFFAGVFIAAFFALARFFGSASFAIRFRRLSG